jgi:hypothetical protein
MATLSQLRDALQKQPFRPLVLRLADGTAYVVKHPDFISTPPGNIGMEAYLYTEGDRPCEFTSHWIDLMNVVEIVFRSPAEPAPSAAGSAERNGA